MTIYRRHSLPNGSLTWPTGAPHDEPLSKAVEQRDSQTANALVFAALLAELGPIVSAASPLR
jgi:hypothetical protein